MGYEVTYAEAGEGRSIKKWTKIYPPSRPPPRYWHNMLITRFC